MSAIPGVLPGNVVLEGHIDVPSDRIGAVVEALPEHIALTRAEPGCRYFDVSADKDVQGRFNVYEIFEGRQAFEGHQKRAVNSSWGQVASGIERHYVVTDVGG